MTVGAETPEDIIVFIVHRDRGVLGNFRTTSPTFVGLGQGDTVYWADSEGRLWAARDPAAATVGDFVERARFPGALGWDAAGDLVVAVTGGDEVALSRDGGTSFVRERPNPGQQVVRALARHDGVLVAQTTLGGSLSTTVSTDRGHSWQPSEFQPNSLRRTGAWIYACGTVLSDDGRQ